MTYVHRLGGVCFSTENTLATLPLASKKFKLFSQTCQTPEVHQFIIGIGREDARLASLTSAEINCVRKCLLPPFLGRGIQTLAPTFSGKIPLLIKSTRKNRESGFQVPLVKAPLVRQTLKKCFQHPDQVFLVLHDLTVEIRDYLTHETWVFYDKEAESAFRRPWVDNGVRSMFAAFLPDFFSSLIHSCAIVINGKAAVLLGASSAGKTRAARLAERKVVLNDDHNILRQDRGSFNIHSTPWGRICAGPKAASLGGLFYLEKADNFAILPIHPRKMIDFLWNENLPTWRQYPRDRRLRVFLMICEACRAVPTYTLRFPKDYIDWDAVDRAMEKG